MCAGFAIYYEKLKKAQVEKYFDRTELEKYKKAEELFFLLAEKSLRSH